MSNEILKFTKIWFLVSGMIEVSFAIMFFFAWDWFFVGIQQWPYNDPALPLIFGGAVLSLAILCWFSFFEKEWSAVKIPVIAELVFCFSGFVIMIVIQFVYPIHNWNWFNTLSYLFVGIGFTIALILQMRAKKTS
ncbi:MAG: hypothetical protein FK732_08180 [Asgard group archaeon]|nr:hypothetical protein [Asgard group archaeon]